ncbi:hypothetical protein PIB30_096431 [Stylosanthes scabra]|uniref:Uncharacterized protein n=1 Tax=Stylosanthes scabra TaxID=79078 RepID=A0ABU6ZUL9_9FABA|nr:hypothetical protein [Stylosanthes scabra]
MAASTTGRRKRRDRGSGCEGTEEGKTEWWFRWLQRTPAVKKLDGGRRARRPRRRKLNGGDRESSVFLLSLWRRRKSYEALLLPKQRAQPPAPLNTLAIHSLTPSLQSFNNHRHHFVNSSSVFHHHH